jgi:hypothetical protein
MENSSEKINEIDILIAKLQSDRHACIEKINSLGKCGADIVNITYDVNAFVAIHEANTLEFNRIQAEFKRIYG